MTLSLCKKCGHHIESVADCTLCRHGNDVNHRVIFNGAVLSCPKDLGKR